MQLESSKLIGLKIYTKDGIFVGTVGKIVFDIQNKTIDSFVVNDASIALVEPNIVISIPFSWVSGVGDIIILKRFPLRIFRDGTIEGL